MLARRHTKSASPLRVTALAAIFVAVTVAWLGGPSSASAETGSCVPLDTAGLSDGNFLGKNPEEGSQSYEDNTSPSAISDNTSFLEKLSDPDRQSGTVSFVTRVDNPSSSFECNINGGVGVKVGPDGDSGTWKSLTKICFVIVKAGSDKGNSGGGVAIYEYSGSGVTQGSWTTEELQNKNISHMDFYECVDTTADTGKITIEKQTEVDGDDEAIDQKIDQDFEFQINGSSVGSINTFDDGNPASIGPFILETGTVTVSEVLDGLPSSIDLTDVSCEYGNSNSGQTLSDSDSNDASFTFDLAKDDEVECTFTNKLNTAGDDVTLRVAKVLTDSQGNFVTDEKVDIKAEQDETSSTVTVDTNGVFDNFNQTTFSADVAIEVSELLSAPFPSNATPVRAECTSLSGDLVQQSFSGDESTEATISIGSSDLGSGDVWSCTFFNEIEGGTITVKKETIGGKDTFDFTLENGTVEGFQLTGGQSITFTRDVGSYTIMEEDLPEGWSLKSFSCSGGGTFNKDEREVTVSLEKDEVITCTFVNFKEDDEEMKEEVEQFNETTLQLLLSHGPDRARLVRRLQQEQPVSLKDTSPLPPLKMKGKMTAEGMQGSFSTSLSQVRASMMAQDAQKIRKAQQGDGTKSSFADDPYIAPYMMTRPGWDLWVEGQISRYNDDSAGRERDGTFSIFYVGADYAVAPGVIVGALVQVDHTDQDIKGDVWGNIEGTGWMVGPYMGAKIGNNLIFDARAAWGQSDNDIELDSDDVGFRTGDFDMERWLVTGKLTGMYHYNGWRISPHVGVAWGTQDQDAFTNSLGQNVGSSSVTLGQVTFGPEFGYRQTLESGSTIEPHIAIEGIWNFEGNEIDFQTGTESTDDFRAKVEGGVIYATPEGYKFRAAASYDGIGGDDFEAWSAKAWLNIPLD